MLTVIFITCIGWNRLNNTHISWGNLLPHGFRNVVWHFFKSGGLPATRFLFTSVPTLSVALSRSFHCLWMALLLFSADLKKQDQLIWTGCCKYHNIMCSVSVPFLVFYFRSQGWATFNWIIHMHGAKPANKRTLEPRNIFSCIRICDILFQGQC